ncbi:MAG: ATP-binding protein [Pseudomonadota bacterium]
MRQCRAVGVFRAARRASPAAVAVFRQADTATSEVRDDGQWISPADRDRALKRFEQIGSSTGSGLGLAIVEAVARAHGGTCRRKARGQGQTAVVTLAGQGEQGPLRHRVGLAARPAIPRYG